MLEAAYERYMSRSCANLPYATDCSLMAYIAVKTIRVSEIWAGCALYGDDWTHTDAMALFSASNDARRS